MRVFTIPGELVCKNMIPEHFKVTGYFYQAPLRRHSCPIITTAMEMPMLKIKHFFSSADLTSFTYFLLVVLKDNTIQILQRRLKHKKYGHGCLEARAGLAGHSSSASYRLGYNGLHSEPDDVIPFYIWLPARLTLPSLFAGVQLLLIYLC